MKGFARRVWLTVYTLGLLLFTLCVVLTVMSLFDPTARAGTRFYVLFSIWPLMLFGRWLVTGRLSPKP